ncbi:flagellar export protein FliJ [Legionella jamestowniensis]|uniref:Flagellar FliJ protein n=1 Tax=Legionella jamestowniensis TaxID=455 RepID=A0A0W0UH63_9GAMM|nr:flagellar FliJ family protein [Legionella jamestowniensis]KTD07217.1 flagellar protein FliJ [Legionella jamestowniensis]OCH98856.1 flagellar biosynthesis protein FliJ [Legionella jamestowniensis]SFL72349.1 flagellar FliJ protein [Legionella jamestowniensis DSM 19215]
MSSRKERLLKLLAIKERATKVAIENLVRAREQFLSDKSRHNQLLEYRQDYIQQLHNLGDAGCRVGRLRNRIDFIAQLDTALGHMNQHLAQLAKQRSHYEAVCIKAKSEQDAVKRIIERLEEQQHLKQERMEQKESDEYAQKQWYSKGSMINFNVKRGE